MNEYLSLRVFIRNTIITGVIFIVVSSIVLSKRQKTKEIIDYKQQEYNDNNIINSLRISSPIEIQNSNTLSTDSLVATL